MVDKEFIKDRDEAAPKFAYDETSSNGLVACRNFISGADWGYNWVHVKFAEKYINYEIVDLLKENHSFKTFLIKKEADRLVEVIIKTQKQLDKMSWDGHAGVLVRISSMNNKAINSWREFSDGL